MADPVAAGGDATSVANEPPGEIEEILHRCRTGDLIESRALILRISDIQKTLLPKGMPLAEYLKLAKEALTQQDVMGKKFTYHVVGPKNDGSIEFSWSIKLGDASQSRSAADEDEPLPDIQFSVRGALTLQKVRDGRHLLGQYLDLLVEQKSILKAENAKLMQQNETFVAEKERTMALFDKLIAEKKALEQELYTKFVIVLNEKKEKIRELKDQIQEMTLRGVPAPAVRGDGEEAAAAPLRQDTSSESAERPADRGTPPPTPSISLLDAEDSARVQATVRKRSIRPERTNSGGQAPGSKADAQAAEKRLAGVSSSLRRTDSDLRRQAASSSPKNLNMSPRSEIVKRRRGQDTPSVDVEHLLDNVN